MLQASLTPQFINSNTKYVFMQIGDKLTHVTIVFHVLKLKLFIFQCINNYLSKLH